MNNTVEPMSDSVPPRLVVRASLRTDVGLVRHENQDFGTCTTPEEERVSHPGGRLLIVADGMGGHRGGATASRLAAETVKAQYLGSETADITTALRDALTRANARIYSESQSNPDLHGMGTTTSVLAVRGGQAWYAHVGDSRIYLVRNSELQQLTEDHSLVASMVREGLLTSKEAETHPRRNVLQRSMGVCEDVDIDVRGPFPLQEGDTFILCSDGLHGVVKEPELSEVAALPIDEAAEEFVKRALAKGAPDNVTVIVARVERATAEDPADDPHDPYDDTIPARSMQFDETVPDGEVRVVDPAPAAEAAAAKPPQSEAADAAEKVSGPEKASEPEKVTGAPVAPEIAPPAAAPVATAAGAAAAVALPAQTQPAGSLLKWVIFAIATLAALGSLYIGLNR